jgi:hypothetical protein
MWPNLTWPNLTWPNLNYGQTGSDEVDIFSHFVDILTVGNLDVDTGAKWQNPSPGTAG